MTEMMLLMSLAGFGAALQELFHWYGLRTHLDKKKYQRALQSKAYWLFTGLFIISAAVLALIWFGEQQHFRKIDVVFFGLSLPLILKRALVAFGGDLRLGEHASSYFDLK